MSRKPHIVLVIARGEAVRNFIFSDTLPTLAKRARVTVLSPIEHPQVLDHARPYIEQWLPLQGYREHPLVTALREIAHTAHYRWLWSEAVKYYWGRRNAKARTLRAKIRLYGVRALAYPLASRPMLRLATCFDRALSWHLRPTHDFDRLFHELRPDLVFNGSHIHGPLADLPLRVAHRLGIPTAGFIFSWDNLTSRSRIFVPYDHYLVWTEGIKRQLLDLYPEVKPEQVHVTGTPQFDFHFNPKFILPREELCRRVGLDPKRPFILYTTGMGTDFPEEHRIVEAVIQFVNEIDVWPRPQLLVRLYIKRITPEMHALALRPHPNTVFPPIQWDEQWKMPLYDDLSVYSSLLHHCALGINAASTVSLELMMLDKPVINLGFEPPGANLPHWSRFSRHIEYEHYRPVAKSGGVMVARSIEDVRDFIYQALTRPEQQSLARKRFIRAFFGDTLDGKAGARVGDILLQLASTP